MYKIIAIIGEAGTGKDTILKQVVNKLGNNCNEIVSYTTRPMREGEQDGINYHFVTSKEFLKLTQEHQMLESTYFNDWFYGTAIPGLDPDKINVGVFNPEGVYSLSKHKNIDLKVYRIYCDSKNRLLRQLNRETNPNTDEIVRRYFTDNKDFKVLNFNYEWLDNITKEDLENCVDTIVLSNSL